jgi:hypothetical protein
MSKEVGGRRKLKEELEKELDPLNSIKNSIKDP